LRTLALTTSIHAIRNKKLYHMKGSNDKPW
jgi:hypothetical protein